MDYLIFFIGSSIGVALVTILIVVSQDAVHPENVIALAIAIVLLAVGTQVHS